MTKIILLALTLGIQIVCNAQLEKGTKFIGGNINYRNQSTNYDGFENFNNSNVTKAESFIINPTIGYFVSDKIAIGLDLFYQVTQQKRSSFSSSQPVFDPVLSTSYQELQTINSYGIGGFVNYYIPIVEKLNFLVNTQVSYINSKFENEFTNPRFDFDQKGNGFEIRMSPGLIYFVSPKLSLQTKFADIHYSSIKITQTGTSKATKTSDFGIGADTSTFFVGLNYYFK